MEFKYSDRYSDYLVWIRNTLSENGLPVLGIQDHENGQHRFHVRSSAELGELRRLFYPNGVKTVPTAIRCCLTDPLSLAIWYMDDGTLDFRELYHCNVSFATYSFTFDECKLLVETLKENFGIKSSVTKSTMRGKVYPRLYIWSRSMKVFLDLVDPYILPCMSHKTIRALSSL